MFPGGPVIPGSRRNLFKDQSFGEREGDNTSTKADRLHAKEEVGSAPGMVQCRGTRRWGTVVSVCLMPGGCRMPVVKRRNT